MVTEINWKFSLYKDGELVITGVMSTIDLNFPHVYFNQLVTRYDATGCKLVVKNSVGEIYEKEWP